MVSNNNFKYAAMKNFILLSLLLFIPVLVSFPVFAELDNTDSTRENGELNKPRENYFETAHQAELDKQYQTGIALLHGINAEKNEPQAYHWFRLAAEQGHAEAQASLGDMYLYGKGVGLNYFEALDWYNKAAAAGSATAQYGLYVMHINGFGVRRDETQAVEWLTRSARGGLAAAQTKLGIMYRAGIHLPRDPEQAVQWLRLAADQDDPEAQYHLARQYAMGIGVERDFVQSYVWYELADDACPIDANRSQCAEFRDSVARVLTPGELAHAEQLAKQMKQKFAESTQSGKTSGGDLLDN
jgi:hypothetical protein